MTADVHRAGHLAVAGPGARCRRSGELASYLQLVAQHFQARIADQLGRLPLHQPWTTRWVHGPPPGPRYIADCHRPGGRGAGPASGTASE
jgi:hypothetical protein